MDVLISKPAKAELFGSLFQHIKLFSEHVNISFTETGMYMQCMDHSHVSIMELNLPTNWFDRYECNVASTIGLSSVILFRILGAREKTQQIHLVYSGDDSDRLMIHLTSDNKNEFDKHFEMPLIDVDQESMEIPEVDYQSEISLSSQQFASIINQLKMFGDNMEFQCSEEKIMLASTSQDQGKMFVEIEIDDISAFAIDEGKELNLSFSLTYLHNMCLYNKLAKEVELKFSENYPMKLVYNLDGEEGTMVFFLAPKINDN
jgi:proliferating cell nuclear antigen